MTIDSTLLYVLLLIALAAVCSGLNISLMSLSPADLKRKAKLGNSKAKRVLPFRVNAHLSLASILLVNAGAASATPLVLNTKLNGILAGIISTLLLVVFAELAPQAFFTKHALTLCAYFSPLLRLMVVLTYPISKPLQLAFDNIVGRQEGQVLHSRRELGLLISDHLGETASELDEDEVEIIRGALQLSEKQVSEIMTEIRHVYWLTKDFVIDSRTIDEIKRANWSRIPIFDKDLSKCYGILRMKDLVDIDFDEKSYKVTDLKLLPVKTVGSRTALDTMFRKFIGARTHLMPVEKNGKIVGIITIEDLIEEIIGHEIIDESDHLTHRE
jgi:metal transporter CNNM